jgi:plastocyanin
MPTWSIKIVSSASVTQFVPQGGEPGGPQVAEVGDNVTWGNTTAETHEPWQTDDQYQITPDSVALCEPIAAGDSSTPEYDLGQDGTIYYCCKLHRSERGRIIVTKPEP